MQANIKKTYTGQYILTPEEGDVITKAMTVVKKVIDTFSDELPLKNQEYIFKNNISRNQQEPLDLVNLFNQLELFVDNDSLELTAIAKDE